MLCQSKTICERAANQLDIRMEILITSTDNLSFNFLSIFSLFVKLAAKKRFSADMLSLNGMKAKGQKKFAEASTDVKSVSP